MSSPDDQPAGPAEPPALRTVAGPEATPLSFARVLRHRPAPIGPDTSVTPGGVRIEAWTPSASLVARYRDVVGSNARMPLTFPAIIGTRLHRDLMGVGGLPVNGMGLVHVASEVWSSNRLPLDEPWQLSAWADGSRHTRSGLEIDLWARCETADASWTARVVVLARAKAARGDDPSAAAAVPDLAGPWTLTTPLVADSGAGRAYGRVSGDVNPIHLHALSARPFGFSRAIAHGWWTLPRALALMGVDETPTDAASRLEVSYLRPVLLPSEPMLLGRVGDTESAFVLVSTEGKPHLGGRLMDV
jgi:hypothetical protein